MVSAEFTCWASNNDIKLMFTQPGKPTQNGKVERSHRSDQEEFYQLLSCGDDVDLNKKLTKWENFYNFSRPHGAFAGRTPYEILGERLQ